MSTSQQKALVISIANAPFALALTRSAVKRAGFWGSLKPSVYVPVIRDHKVVFGIYTVLTAVQYAYALKARREADRASRAGYGVISEDEWLAAGLPPERAKLRAKQSVQAAAYMNGLEDDVFVPIFAGTDEAPATLADPDLMRMTELAGYNHAHDLEDRCIRDRSGTCTAPKRPKHAGGLS